MKRERDITKGVLGGGRIIPWEEWGRRRAGKMKRRKRTYLKGFGRWVGSHRTTKREAARAERRKGYDT